MSTQPSSKERKRQLGAQKALEYFTFGKVNKLVQPSSSKLQESCNSNRKSEQDNEVVPLKILDKGMGKDAAQDVSKINTKALLSPAKRWNYDNEHNPEGWAITFKYDGVRSYWNGKSLLTIDGVTINVPAWFIEKFPSDMTFDGEIFVIQKPYDQTKALLNSISLSDWKTVLFHCIDVPSLDSQTFLERRKHMKELSGKINVPWFIVTEPIRCKSKVHLVEILKDVTLRGGAGILLHEPTSLYKEPIDSPKHYMGVQGFLKGEALVVEHTQDTVPGSDGLCLTMTCQTNDIEKKEFAITVDPPQDSSLTLPDIGSTVSFWHLGRSTNGLPTCPRYYLDVVGKV